MSACGAELSGDTPFIGLALTPLAVNPSRATPWQRCTYAWCLYLMAPRVRHGGCDITRPAWAPRAMKVLCSVRRGFQVVLHYLDKIISFRFTTILDFIHRKCRAPWEIYVQPLTRSRMLSMWQLVMAGSAGCCMNMRCSYASRVRQNNFVAHAWSTSTYGLLHCCTS